MCHKRTNQSRKKAVFYRYALNKQENLNRSKVVENLNTWATHLKPPIRPDPIQSDALGFLRRNIFYDIEKMNYLHMSINEQKSFKKKDFVTCFRPMKVHSTFLLEWLNLIPRYLYCVCVSLTQA